MKVGKNVQLMLSLILIFCMALVILPGLTLPAAATGLTPDYYVTGGPGAYAAGTSAGGTNIGTYSTLAGALSACGDAWGEGTPVIQLGSAGTHLSVNRGDGALISATYTGAVNMEYSGILTGGLTVASGVTAGLRDFTLTNSVSTSDTLSYCAIRVVSGGTLNIGDGTDITVAAGTAAVSGSVFVLDNAGTFSATGTVSLSIGTKTYAIYNMGRCTLGGNSEDNISITTSASGGTGIHNFSGGQLTISTGTSISAYNALSLNGGSATISGGTLEAQNTTVYISSNGTLNMTGGTVRNLSTSGLGRALDNGGTAVISGGTITSGGTQPIWTMNKLTLKGDCNVTCTNPSSGVAVDSNSNTRPGSQIIIEESASIVGTSGGVVASVANGSYGTGSSTLEITGGSISGNSFAVQTSADTDISGGRLSATGSNSTALGCYGNRTVDITDGEFTSTGEYYAYGISNNGSTVNFSDGSVTASVTNSSAWYSYGIQNSSGTVNISGGTITAGASAGAVSASTRGFWNGDATAGITGGVISSEGTYGTSSAVIDQTSVSPKGVTISGDTVILKSAAPNTVRLEKRASDTGSLSYFGTSFYTNTNAAVAIQGTYDDDLDTYMISNPGYDSALARAIPDSGYGAPRWTSDAARANTLSTVNGAAVSVLTAGGNTSVYLAVSPAYTATVNTRVDGAAATAPGTVSLKQGGNTYTLTPASMGVYTASVSNGTYEIWINNENTGKTVIINNAAASTTVNYYTVNFSVANSGAAAGSTVTATAGSTPISSGVAVLSGKQVIITAVGAGAGADAISPVYTYAWSGAGTSGQTTAGLTIASLSGAVNATCTVTGSASYPVTLNTNSGTVNSGNITSYVYGTGATLPTNVTKDGSVFGGWYAASDFSGSSVTAIGGTEKGTKAFWAKWVQNPVIATQPQNAALAVGSSATFTVAVSAPSSGNTYQWQKKNGETWDNIAGVTDAAYTISSVAIGDAGQYRCVVTHTDGSISTVTTSGTATLTVGYAITVTNDGHGSGSSSLNAAAPGAEITLTATPTTGYHFLRWDVTAPSGGLTISADNKFTMPAESVSIKAVFTLDTYPVAYYYNFASEGAYTMQTDIPYGSTLTAPAVPVRAGYTFGGWYQEADCVNPWTFESDTIFSATSLYAKWTQNPANNHGGGDTPVRTITVTETSSEIFRGSENQIRAEANMDNAFSNSVEVKVMDTEEDAASFGLTAGSEVYPFDISLYIKGTNEKTLPREGYAVTISLPVPNGLLDRKELLSVVHKSDSGVVTALASQLKQIGGVWYLVFEATEFSPYALVVSNPAAYDESAGVPYYLDAKGNQVFIGFAVDGKYIAPPGAAILFKENSKSFPDVSGHWAAGYIGFATEREIFVGTGMGTFSPDFGMTRAMFATVVGRLYERSYGEIKGSGTHAFTDGDYNDYYGKYVDWCVESNVISGYGDGRFGPNDLITREQMAAILYRFADFLGVLPNDIDSMLNYPDAGAISSWAERAALYCQTTGIISGRTGGVFAPQGTATRAEVATIVQRLVNLVME
ncbi:MAG TPA: S-layer homology domain-containing protein [Negativicutes bacterium]|nr:S-layer homology domain-containing protein [Negativicutes bacterium]